jgi:amidase
MGYIGWLGHIETNDSVFTAILRRLGAVFYGTLPKSLLTQSKLLSRKVSCVARQSIISLGMIDPYRLANNSRTYNPHNNKLSCGGSSGGEGALIALRGSILGLGTDIGGSIRIPAGFNALYGIRPSHGRMPYNMLANSMEGQETIHSGSHRLTTNDSRRSNCPFRGGFTILSPGCIIS